MFLEDVLYIELKANNHDVVTQRDAIIAVNIDIYWIWWKIWKLHKVVYFWLNLCQHYFLPNYILFVFYTTMGDKVQPILEKMSTSLDELENHHIFSKVLLFLWCLFRMK